MGALGWRVVTILASFEFLSDAGLHLLLLLQARPYKSYNILVHHSVNCRHPSPSDCCGIKAHNSAPCMVVGETSKKRGCQGSACCGRAMSFIEEKDFTPLASPLIYLPFSFCSSPLLSLLIRKSNMQRVDCCRVVMLSCCARAVMRVKKIWCRWHTADEISTAQRGVWPNQNSFILYFRVWRIFLYYHNFDWTK